MTLLIISLKAIYLTYAIYPKQIRYATEQTQ